MLTYHVSILPNNTPVSRVQNYTIAADDFSTKNGMLTFFMLDRANVTRSVATFLIADAVKVTVVSELVTETNDELVKLVVSTVTDAVAEPAPQVEPIRMPADPESIGARWARLAAEAEASENPMDRFFDEDEVFFQELADTQHPEYKHLLDLMASMNIMLQQMLQHNVHTRYDTGRSGLC